MDINKVIVSGVIGEPKIGWLESGKPELQLNLTIEQEGGFKLYVQVFCYGKDAERLAETLEAGDRVLIDGKLSWRSTVKTGVKESRMVVACYGVERLASSPVDERSGDGATVSEGELENVAYKPTSVPSMFDGTTRRPRKRPYPKAALHGGFDR
jgi:single-stranded DNA-binding protein